MSFKRNNLIVLLVSVSILALCVLVYFQFFVPRIAFINVPKLMTEYDAMKVIKGKMEKRSIGYKANVDSLQADFKKLILKHEKEKAGMSKRELDLSIQLLNSKGADLERYQQATRQKLEQEEVDLREQELRIVNDFINEYSKSKGYDYVLAANQAGVLIYAKDKLEITEEVLNQLNEKYRARK